MLLEDDEAALRYGWKPYNLQRGFGLNDNTLTAASALLWGNNLTPATSDSDKIMELMAWDIVEKGQFALGSGNPQVNRTLLITEFVARDLANKYKSKETLEDALIGNARLTLHERAYARYWANPGGSKDTKDVSFNKMKFVLAREEGASETAVPEWLSWSQIKTIQTVPVMEKGKTAIIVTGDTSRNKVMTIPGGGNVTIKIELPQNWDELMKELGYNSLSSYFLKEKNVNSTSEEIHDNKINYEQDFNKSRRSNSLSNKKPSAERYRQIIQERKNNHYNGRKNK